MFARFRDIFIIDFLSRNFLLLNLQELLLLELDILVFEVFDADTLLNEIDNRRLLDFSLSRRAKMSPKFALIVAIVFDVLVEGHN